jgi:hypothetical protein
MSGKKQTIITTIPKIIKYNLILSSVEISSVYISNNPQIEIQNKITIIVTKIYILILMNIFVRPLSVGSKKIL